MDKEYLIAEIAIAEKQKSHEAGNLELAQMRHDANIAMFDKNIAFLQQRIDKLSALPVDNQPV